MDRIDRIWAEHEELMTTCKGAFADDTCINLLEEPGFCEMSFMKRKARMIEKTLEHNRVRIFADELLAGTPLETRVHEIHHTLEERRQYADMNLMYPPRNNRVIDGKNVYFSKARRIKPI